MTKPFVPQIISANDLMSGEVIYMTANGWSHELSRAHVAASLRDISAMLARAEMQSHVAVGPYAVDVLIDDAGVPMPKLIREKMRVRGPSIDVPHTRYEAAHVSL